MQITLLGTSPNLDMAAKLVTEYFCGQAMRIENEQVFRVSDRKHIEGLRVVQKGQRYRFEMVNP